MVPAWPGPAFGSAVSQNCQHIILPHQADILYRGSPSPSMEMRSGTKCASHFKKDPDLSRSPGPAGKKPGRGINMQGTGALTQKLRDDFMERTENLEHLPASIWSGSSPCARWRTPSASRSTSLWGGFGAVRSQVRSPRAQSDPGPDAPSGGLTASLGQSSSGPPLGRRRTNQTDAKIMRQIYRNFCERNAVSGS